MSTAVDSLNLKSFSSREAIGGIKSEAESNGSKRNSSVEMLVEGEMDSLASEEDTEFLDEEQEVDLEEVVVGQEIVEMRLEPSVLLYVKRDAASSKRRSLTKILREFKRPPRNKTQLARVSDVIEKSNKGAPPLDVSNEPADKDLQINRESGGNENGDLKGGKKTKSKGREERETRFECHECGRSFREKSHLATHYRAHIDTRKYKCDKCGLRFKTSSNLEFHSQTHADAPFTCVKCNKTYPERKMLKRHLRVVHSGEVHACDQCERTFKCRGTLLLHYTVHTGAKPHRCAECGKGFVYRSTLVAHERGHQSGPSQPRPWLCTVCGKAYPLSATLNNHMKTHLPHKPFQCKECPKSFMKKESYECHMKQHRGEGPEYMCDQCSRSYFTVFGLKRHYAKHTSGKSFECAVCGKAFWTKDALRVHLRTHAGLKSFECGVCGKAFSHKHSLEAHARGHETGPQGPLQCPSCGRAFLHSYNLTRHTRHHHS